jgi:hypothetical protein
MTGATLNEHEKAPETASLIFHSLQKFPLAPGYICPGRRNAFKKSGIMV